MHFSTITALIAAVVAVSAHANAGQNTAGMAKRLDEPLARRGGKMHRRNRKRGSCKAASASTSAPAYSSAAWSSTPASSTATPVAAFAAAGKNDSTSSSPEAAPTSSGSDSSSSDVLTSSGVSSFLGTNTGIGSWFKTDSSTDSTNGRSWCQLNYQDDWIGFAPDVSTMLNNFGGDTTKAGTAYCGLEATATNPSNGKTVTMYIVDGFDSAWVRSPGSVDLTMGAFEALFEYTDDKDTVIQNLQWKLTGNRKEEYSFNYGS